MSEVEALRQRVYDLERLLGMHAIGIKPDGIAKRPYRVLGMLLQTELVSRQAVLELIDPGFNGKSDKNADVIMMQIRKFLRARGVQLQTSRGVGWFIKPADKPAVLNAIGAPTS